MIQNSKTKEYISTSEAAKLLGISRVSVFKKIKSGDIPAQKIGRNYAIPVKELEYLTQVIPNNTTQKEIETAVKRVVQEYGETLRLLGKE